MFSCVSFFFVDYIRWFKDSTVEVPKTMLTLVSIFGIIALFGDAYSRPQLRAEDLEPFLDNPQALEEFGEILAAEIRLADFLKCTRTSFRFFIYPSPS